MNCFFSEEKKDEKKDEKKPAEAKPAEKPKSNDVPAAFKDKPKDQVSFFKSFFGDSM